MTRSFRSILVGTFALLIGASALAITTPAGSQVTGPILTLSPTGGASVQTGNASLTGTLDTPCDALPTADAVTVEIGGVAVTPELVSILSTSSFIVVLPAGMTPTSVVQMGSTVEVSIECPFTTSLQTISDGISFAEISVSKAVTGSAPAGATYTIDAMCTPEMTNGAAETWMSPAIVADPTPVQFALAAGGANSIFTFAPYSCVFSESDAMGALSTSIVPGTVETADPIMYRAVVTNAFAEPTPTRPAFTG